MCEAFMKQNVTGTTGDAENLVYTKFKLMNIAFWTGKACFLQVPNKLKLVLFVRVWVNCLVVMYIRNLIWFEGSFAKEILIFN